MMSQTASSVNLPANGGSLSIGFSGLPLESAAPAVPSAWPGQLAMYTSGKASHPSVRFILKGAQKRRSIAYRRAREIQMELGLIDAPRPTGVSR